MSTVFENDIKVIRTAAEQEFCEAQRELATAQTELATAQTELATAQTALKNATEANDQARINVAEARIKAAETRIKAEQARIAAEQARIAAAVVQLAQLAQAETMESERLGREGHAALMQTTERTAYQVCTKIGALMGLTATQVNNEQINALASVLQALAQLSPMAIKK